MNGDEVFHLASWGKEGDRIRFGMDTLWAISHPNWMSERWFYTYDNCDMERGY